MSGASHPVAAARQLMSALRAVVVGASAAGMAAADGLREGGWTGAVTVLGAEAHDPYDRPMLSKTLLAGSVGRPLPLRTAEQLDSRQITLLLDCRVMGLDIDRRLVVTNDGEAIPYDVLVVATGTRPCLMPTTSGAALPTLFNLDDARTLHELVSGATSVAIVGSGYIGLEAAAALRYRGLRVEMFGRQRLPLAADVGEEVSRWLCDLHIANGVRARHGVEVTAVHGAPGDFRVELADRTTHRVDVVLTGTGARPDDAWLNGSGVRLNDGVVGDAYGRTSVPDVWVAGDVANVPEPVTGRRRSFRHWTNAVEHGRQVGLNAAGHATGRPPDPLSQQRNFWTEQYGRTIRCLGERPTAATDVVVLDTFDRDEFVVLHLASDAPTNAAGGSGVVRGVTSCGVDRSQRVLRRLLSANASQSEFSAAVGSTAVV
jgi:NADPH-dependent 2,4-dienoyl-CoA reductase/sulfur reductase-like enzyme